MDSVHHPIKRRKGSWGYYTIERGRDFSDAPNPDCPRVVELYVY